MIAILTAVAPFAAECIERPTVRVDGTVVSVTFCPPVTSCVDGCWAGATVRRSDATIVDLAPVEVSRLGAPITVTGEVGANASEFMAGLWEERRPTCDAREKRPGCGAYGILDDPLWSWPEYNYYATPSFMDIRPLNLSVLDAGAGPAVTAKIRRVLQEAIAQNTLGLANGAVSDGGTATAKRQHVEILYRDKWDRTAAWRLAEVLKEGECGFRWTVKHWPEAGTTFVIAAGGA